MNSPASWTEQWDRVYRWLRRVQESAIGRMHDSPTDVYQDDVYAFFQNCYHLKDWLKNDVSSASVVRDVEALISASPELSLCADLANGSKHLKLTRHRVDPDARVGQRDYSLDIGSQGITIAVRYVIEAGGSSYEAVALAESCYRTWEDYLLAKHLLDARRVVLPPVRPLESQN
jgi:hypothetical protein